MILLQPLAGEPGRDGDDVFINMSQLHSNISYPPSSPLLSSPLLSFPLLLLLFLLLLVCWSEMAAPAVMRCFEGRRGPGRQSALAALHTRQLDPRTDLQDLQDLQGSGGTSGVVRGTLPQVLRGVASGLTF